MKIVSPTETFRHSNAHGLSISAKISVSRYRATRSATPKRASVRLHFFMNFLFLSQKTFQQEVFSCFIITSDSVSCNEKFDQDRLGAMRSARCCAVFFVQKKIAFCEPKRFFYFIDWICVAQPSKHQVHVIVWIV